MTTSNDDVYKQIISIQHTLYDQHSQIREELDGLKEHIYSIKEEIEGRLSPLGDKVERHEHNFKILSSAFTWILPSGAGIIAFFCWLGGMFTPHK
jgi:hypothetical protein